MKNGLLVILSVAAVGFGAMAFQSQRKAPELPGPKQSVDPQAEETHKLAERALQLAERAQQQTERALQLAERAHQQSEQAQRQPEPAIGAVIGAVDGSATGPVFRNSLDKEEQRQAIDAIMAQQARHAALSLQEIAQMAQNHVSNAVILSQIQASGVHFALTVDQINYLHEYGVSDRVIVAMQQGLPPVDHARLPQVYEPPPPPSVVVALASQSQIEPMTRATRADEKQEVKELPELAKVVNDDKKKISKLMVLTSIGHDRAEKEVILADRELGYLIVKQMNALSAANGQKLTIISPYKVEEYKSKHPNWQDLDTAAIGRQFGVDYVMVVNIQSMSMYEQGSSLLVYRGRVGLDVSLTAVNEPDSYLQGCSLNYAYPSEAKVAVADADLPWPQFRMRFLTHVAKQISYKFLEHQKQSNNDVD